MTTFQKNSVLLPQLYSQLKNSKTILVGGLFAMSKEQFKPRRFRKRNEEMTTSREQVKRNGQTELSFATGREGSNQGSTENSRWGEV